MLPSRGCRGRGPDVARGARHGEREHVQNLHKLYLGDGESKPISLLVYIACSHLVSGVWCVFIKLHITA